MEKQKIKKTYRKLRKRKKWWQQQATALQEQAEYRKLGSKRKIDTFTIHNIFVLKGQNKPFGKQKQISEISDKQIYLLSIFTVYIAAHPYQHSNLGRSFLISGQTCVS